MSARSVAFLLVAGFVACSRPAPPERSTTAPAVSASASANESPQANTKMRGWQQGQLYIYRYHSTSQIALGDKTPLYDFDLTCRAELTALEVGANSASFYLKLDDVKVVSRIPNSQAEFDKLIPKLAAPYFFDMKGGLVSAANLPEDLHPLATAWDSGSPDPRRVPRRR